VRVPRIIGALLTLFALAAVATAGEAPAFPYDASKTETYLGQTLIGSSNPSATDLRQQLSNVVDEILDGPWLPLCSDYSAGEAGGVGTAEWCFNRPGDCLTALSQAAPCLAPDQRTRAGAFLRELIRSCPPTRDVFLPARQGKPRNVRKAPPPAWPALAGPEAQRALFAEAYAVWACASAFDLWDDTRPLFEDLRRLRSQLGDRGDFAPAYKPEHAGPLTVALAQDPEYRFKVYQALLAGFQDNYWYRGAQEARQRVPKDRPVFFYVKQLSALLGYYRLARHFGDQAEAAWARDAFERVASLALTQRSAPFLWSDPSLCPEFSRLLRDAAGSWLDELSRTPNVGNLPAVDWDNKIVPSRRDYYAMNPFTWYHAWGGQGEGIRPRTVMGAFLVNALLFHPSAEDVARTLDVPWCKADLYYARKLVTTIQVTERARWVQVP
jgi:hypothetical protein